MLIVDDSLTVRMDLKEAFEAAGFRVEMCATAAEARRAFSSETLGLVVLDVFLPDADGIDLLRELRASPRAAVPVMLLSSEADVRDRIRGLRTGADEYVGKPYDPIYMVTRARELLPDVARTPTSTVLVIDDSATFREEMRRALTEQGHAVVLAESGEAGLRLAAEARPAAIVVDGRLPGIDGSTVVRRIRLDAALRQTPCLLLTGSDEPGAELRALDAGADAFVRKGEATSVVLARIGALLRTSAERGARGADSTTASLLGPKKILAVDDSLTYLHELAAALRGEGYDVVLARSGEEALELLAVQRVECILLDLLMPGLSGQETCQRIKAAPGLRDTPIIMLTAVDDPDMMIRGLGAGADDYISKSSDFEVLRARVRVQLRRRQLEDEGRSFREQLLRAELDAAQARAAHEIAETRAALAGELERKNRELEAFSYTVSHDLRAPLRSIDGFSLALLEDCGDRLDGQGQDHLRRIRAAARRMSDLIDDLLELSRVGRWELLRQQVDLSALARDVVGELRQSAPERAARVVVQDGLVVDGDPRLLRVVLENLLGNAWKFTGKVAEPMIEVGADETQAPATYFVRDNGAGFDMAHVGQLFAPFRRLHSAADFSGTGIGLATVQRIVERHGGRVWAEGEVGRGATVSWTLPPSTGGGRP